MRHMYLASMSALSAALILLAQMPAAGQQRGAKAAEKTATPAPDKFTVSRTAWGDPNLEGVYTFATLTPFQRPAAQAGKDVLTEEEQKALKEQLKKKQAENIATNEHFSYNALWFASDQGRPTGRTSIIVDPEDGRLPPFTERGEKLRAEMRAQAARKRIGKDVLVDTWEDLSIYNRCIARPMQRL